MASPEVDLGNKGRVDGLAVARYPVTGFLYEREWYPE
jgi:hypothetical protein